jgi:uncharacterized protein YjbI with pentapeptide repeats
MAEERGEQAAMDSESRKPWTLREYVGKTVWDWMQLLVIPLVLAIFGFAFTWTQDRRAQAIEDQRTQGAAVQAYLDKMGDLMLQRDLGAKEESTARTLARARTLTVLEQLDADHKRTIVRFLWESGLVQAVKGRSEPNPAPIAASVIDLKGADLNDTNLHAADLYGADLGEGIEPGSLEQAYKIIITLQTRRTRNLVVPTPQLRTNLSGADLSDGDLRYADLVYVDLHNANLGAANLWGAVLYGADLSGSNLSRSGAELSIGSANLTGAILMHADLSYAALEGAILKDANLHNADLTYADLKDADLRGADLTEAHETTYEYPAGATEHLVTNEEICQQTKNLEGATMPNGQKFEDWLKDWLKSRGPEEYCGE